MRGPIARLSHRAHARHAEQSVARRGAAIAELTLFPQAWKHRRVDSMRLESGDRGRWRISIDCTVPNDVRLTWSRGRDAQLVVPITLFRKGPLKDFNITGPDGAPLPVLGMRDSAALALEMLRFTLSVDGRRTRNWQRL
ncbi:hypothetical protein EXU48_01915 [Occultella glacieicola]|uniref:Uncharacterized protein n=1 Tax=Occultella glacieicola TaxID=2518684 RepID=A0ABY2EB19_9MICO|nr:hypothetical protein [Occultella glacieicola]TDE98968.1 hypothetical protein EXU48_01915 [Occultella glacieicola]